MLLFILLACDQIDYQLKAETPHSEGGEVPTGYSMTSWGADSSFGLTHGTRIVDVLNDLLLGESVHVRVDSAIQRMGWGSDVKRCQIQVIFSNTSSPPVMDYGNSYYPNEPAEKGDCAFTRYENKPDPFMDNWFISGDLSGPNEIYLRGIHRDLTLHLVHAEDGQLRYEYEDCLLENFPFEEIFDLDVPASNSNELDNVYMENVLGIGPDIEFVLPNDIQQDGMYHGFGTEDLPVQWLYKGDSPKLNGVELQQDRSVRLTNNRKHQWNAMEKMDCWPEFNDNTTVSADDISLFTLNDYVGQEEYSIGLNIHTVYEISGIQDHTLELFESKSTISIGGMMDIVESELNE